MLVTLQVHRSNGQRVTDLVVVPEQDEANAVCRAIDAAILAYPRAKSIMWESVVESDPCDDVFWIGIPECQSKNVSEPQEQAENRRTALQKSTAI